MTRIGIEILRQPSKRPECAAHGVEEMLQQPRLEPKLGISSESQEHEPGNIMRIHKDIARYKRRPTSLSRLPKNTIVRALMRRSELAWTNIRHPGSDNSPDIVLNHCSLTNKWSNYMPFTSRHRQSKEQTNASNIRGVSSQPARRNISHPQSVEGEVSVVSSRMHTQRADITEHARKDTRRCSHCNSDMRTNPGCWLSYWH